MRNSITKVQLVFVFIFIGVCIFIFQKKSYEYEEKQLIVTTTPIIKSTRKVISKQYSDFVELSRDLREYAATHDDTLEQQLFPWWLYHQNGDHSKLPYNESKGIVICTGNKHFKLTLVALGALELIGNELPIEVIYSTTNDLSLENRQELEKLYPKIRLIDLSSTSLNDSYLELRGWEIKPFAVLASQFQQVILMDADVLFLEKPSILFENSYYLETGSLFFYDRTTHSADTIHWIRTLFSQNNTQNIPQHTQESGVVLIDKARVLTGLLSICKLNDHHEREKVTYQRLYGDKDTWWLGFHLIQMPYSFIPTFTAAIGHVKHTGHQEVCGHILHLDEKYRPIWWNGGLFRNRYIDTNQLLSIECWLIEGHWAITAYSCLTNTGEKPKQFDQDHQRLINGYISITKNVFNIK